MAKTFDYFFDFGSLAAYLAHTQMDKIKAETGAQPIYLPMLLGAVFKATMRQGLSDAVNHWAAICCRTCF